MGSKHSRSSSRSSSSSTVSSSTLPMAYREQNPNRADWMVPQVWCSQAGILLLLLDVYGQELLFAWGQRKERRQRLAGYSLQHPIGALKESTRPLHSLPSDVSA